MSLCKVMQARVKPFRNNSTSDSKLYSHKCKRQKAIPANTVLGT